MPNLPYGFDVYKVKIKTTRQIGQIFVAFSEKLNVTKTGDIHTRFIVHKTDDCVILIKKTASALHIMYIV